MSGSPAVSKFLLRGNRTNVAGELEIFFLEFKDREACDSFGISFKSYRES